MFDISFPELIVVGAIALVVLGPERLPTAARTAGLWLGKIKRTVSSVQQEITSQLETEELQRKMKSQQDRFDQGLKKARDDIESLGDDPSASSRKLSDRALSDDRSADRQKETSDAESASDRHAHTADPSTAPAPDRHANTADPATAPAPASEAASDEQKPSDAAASRPPASDRHDRDNHDR
ncbi:Sec-independent protein translocase protein TatB [Kushneria indalinina]|uniref:Sec-independent protein translocase protein TatB n=1 Tax=Kushneria indalinina DSM 14324 TaxID=1122140 RepID=A0A3D9DTR1_9GAMM|nr:Sec-independent protein translocase protein TatB [Kushneria indalinina]REC94107.1 sec-independent protein translocase protein TatB [Kushneria indalinina DSM 14324]